jgi:hypothetical protein
MLIQQPAHERFLYGLWLHPPFKDERLRTCDGIPLEIWESGVRNEDAGPDFLNALLVLDGKIVRGDVEIHSRCQDWIYHGHDRDPHYNGVILHVVTETVPEGFVTRRQDGRIVPILNLDAILATPADILESHYPSTFVFPQTLSCGLKEHPERIPYILERYGMERFILKRQRCHERSLQVSWDQVLYELVLEALGYNKNQLSCLRLARRLPVDGLKEYSRTVPEENRTAAVRAVLLGAAGLLTHSSLHLNEPARHHLESFWQEYRQAYSVEPLVSTDWMFFRTRPANFPTRRLSAAAGLFLRFFSDDGIADMFCRLVRTGIRPSQLVRDLMARVSGDPGDDKENRIGSERARDMVVNALLPVLAAWTRQSGQHRLENRVKEAYRCCPGLAENASIRDMRKRLSCSLKQIPLHTAVCQQGALQLFYHHCQGPDCRACLSP